MSSAPSGEFWEKPPAARKPGRRRRRWLVALGCVLGVLLLLVALAPTIAGWIAPGYVESALAGSVQGSASVEGVSLSWFGDQEAGPIVIRDASGTEVARVHASVSTGLFGLLGGLDLGVVRVSGSAYIVREADGTLNLQRVFQGSPGAAPPTAAAETRLPSSLESRLLIEEVTVVFEDRTPGSGGVIRIGNVHGRGAFEVGGPLTLEMSADTWHGPTVAAATTPGGTLTLAADLNGLTTSSGLLRPEAATGNVSVDAKALSSALADIAAGMKGRLSEAFGPTVTLNGSATGSMQDATATIVMTSPGASADFGVRLAAAAGGSTLALTRTGKLHADTSGLAALAPGVAEALLAQRDDVQLTQWPEVTVTVEQFRVLLPESGPIDLRKAAVTLHVQTTETGGKVATPGQDAMQDFRVAPLALSLTGDLGSLLKVKADTSVTLGGQPAGTLAVDLAAGGLLDESGHLRAGLPGSISGSASLAGVTTAIAQPFLEQGGVDLGTDVGPTVDLTLAASSAGGESDPRTDLSLQVVCENVRTVLFATARGTTITSRDKGMEVRVVDLGPLLERLGSGVSLTVENGGALVISSPEFSIDTTRLAAGDYRGVSGMLKVGAPTADGTIVLRPGEPAQGWSMAPTSIALDAKDLAARLTLTAGTSANLGGKPAGTLAANLTLEGLLDKDGALNVVPAAPVGTVELTSASTAIAQPWAAALGLDLPQDIGPWIDLRLAASQPTPGESHVDVTATSEHITAAAALTLGKDAIKGRDAERSQAIEVTLRNAGAIAARLLQSPGGDPGGTLAFRLQGLDLPLREGSPRFDLAAADATLSVSDLAVDVPGPGGAGTERVQIASLRLGAALAPSAPARVTVQSEMSRAGAPFTATGDLAIAGLFGADGSIVPDPAALRPIGTIEFTDVPTTLVGLAAAPETASLLREALGPAVSVNFTSAKAAVGDALDVRAGVTSQSASVKLVAGLNAGRLDIGRLEGDLALTPGLVAHAFEAYAPAMEPRPNLRAPATAQFSVSPTRIPLGAGLAPEFAKAGDLSLRVAVREPIILEGFASEGQPNPGPAGIRGFEMRATFPLAAALGSAEGPAEVTIRGELTGAEAEAGQLAIHAKTTLAAGKPSGTLESTVKVTKVATTLVDAFAGKPGMVSGAIGPWATIDAGVSGTFTPDQSGAMQPDLTFRAEVAAPLLTTTRPLSGTVKGGVLTMPEPAVLAWKMDPRWGTTWLLAQAPAEAKTAPMAQFEGPTEVTVSIFRLAIPTSGPPMSPGVFGFDASADAPRVTVMAAEGTRSRFEAFKLRAQAGGEGQEPGVVGLSVRMNNQGGEQGSALNLSGGIYQLADAQGNLTTDAAILTLRGGATAFPTAMIDALARQGGVLVEALGPTVSLDLNATGLSTQGGTISVKATSPRASVDLKGGIRDGAFRAAGAVQGQLVEITPEFGSLLVKGLPAVATFQKQKEDGPAKLTATNVTAPIDGDLRKLNADVVIELGTVRFDTSNVFSKLLKVAGQQQAGSLGRKVEPLKLTIRDGVVTYDRYRIPLGEFTVLARGEVNLVDRTLDVVTYVPIGALTDEVAGVFDTGLGKTLGRVLPPLERVTMVPIRTRGSFESPSTSPDVGLFAKEFGQNLLRPDQYLKELFGGG